MPLEGKVRVQLNLKVDHAPQVESVKRFRSFVFPVMWLEEGVSELTPPIRRWIYLGTVIAPIALPLLAYSMIVSGLLGIIVTVARAYQNYVFTNDPTLELLEMGRRSLRRGSSLIINHNHHHRLVVHRDSYHLLKSPQVSEPVTREDPVDQSEQDRPLV